MKGILVDVKHLIVWGLPFLAYAVGVIFVYKFPLAREIEFVSKGYRMIGFNWTQIPGRLFGSLLSMAILTYVLVLLISKILDKRMGFDSHNHQTLKYSVVRAFLYFSLVVFASGLYGQKLTEEKLGDPINFALAAIVALIFASVIFVIKDALDALHVLFKRSKQ